MAADAGQQGKPGPKAQFFRTAMCRFATNCREGDKCCYAHSLEEMRPQPCLRKTALCKNYSKGWCDKAKKDCPFAHGSDDYRFSHDFRATEEYQKKIPLDGPFAFADPFPNGVIGGTPPISDESQQESDRAARTTKTAIQEAAMPQGASTPSTQDDLARRPSMRLRPAKARQRRSKTVLCRFAASGRCKNGDACNFAHSETEWNLAVQKCTSESVEKAAVHIAEAGRKDEDTKAEENHEGKMPPTPVGDHVMMGNCNLPAPMQRQQYPNIVDMNAQQLLMTGSPNSCHMFSMPATPPHIVQGYPPVLMIPVTCMPVCASSSGGPPPCRANMVDILTAASNVQYYD